MSWINEQLSKSGRRARRAVTRSRRRVLLELPLLVRWPFNPRRILRFAFLCAVVVGGFFAIQAVARHGDLEPVCAQARHLRRARLLSPSRRLFESVRAAANDATCAVDGLRVVSAKEKQRDQAVVRGTMYRRTAALKRKKLSRGARRAAYFLALRWYILALRRDSRAKDARAGLRALINAPAPIAALTSRQRCQLGDRLVGAGLLPQAAT